VNAMSVKPASACASWGAQISGEFIDFAGVDHWLFVSSNGGLTAGRVSPKTALFPYITVDKIHDSISNTGPKTILRVLADGLTRVWEPFNTEHDGAYAVSRNLYKSLLGNKLCFEEFNHDLQLVFRHTWATSDNYGFVRQCELENPGDKSVSVDLLDGLQNILPAGTPMFAQSNTSNLVDAYKWSELDESTGLAFLTLYSGITDRAEPSESLKANTVFCLGLDAARVLISSNQLDDFRRGATVQQESRKRGIRCAYFVNQALELGPQSSQRWQIVANVEQSQADAVELRMQLAHPADVAEAVTRSVATGADQLARIMASGDGYQATAEENVTVHHYANVLFNILRGGVFDDQYNISAVDFSATIRNFNMDVYRRNRDLLEGLPQRLKLAELLATIGNHGDRQLERLAHEYLPITFGRRHGDPSRPWNEFAINVKDENGDGLLSYQGNWRDIFQNWEALIFSYPGFVENVIAKFVNASTVDGYNPYRITKEGIDWEVEEPDNPWSYIGYWGDHQIIYLLKFLEISRDFHPARLHDLLRQPIFCYANVPYRIKPFEALLENPKSTVNFDEDLAERIEHRVAANGADGKLLLNADGAVYQVNLLEKLLVPLLCKLGNLVVDGGIWLNAQRPEWNDANNALVGHGLSMVTLYYLRRYVRFLQQLLAEETESFALSGEVSQWLADTRAALKDVRPLLGDKPIDASRRYDSMVELGQAASRYRERVYEQESFSGTADQTIEEIMPMLNDALAAIDHSIGTNRRNDGLYHAYNLLDLQQNAVAMDTLYPMLEGQVAALSTGSMATDEAVAVVEALFDSDVYRPGQNSFMLYPDRALPGFLDKNRVDAARVEAIPLLQSMLAADDERIVVRDAEGCELASAYGDELDAAREPLQELYESVFEHKAFTGRSGTMFGFEGLGSIYWHMVSKLMLAVQENFFAAPEKGADKATRRQLGQLYYRVRNGIGFNKTPAEYGAFPTDPYSGELGVRVSNGAVHFQPDLLRARELMAESRNTGYVDVDGNWQTISVPSNGLAFTWCQVPIVYKLDDSAPISLTVVDKDGNEQTLQQLDLPAAESAELFQRSGRIRQLTLNLHSSMLFAE